MTLADLLIRVDCPRCGAKGRETLVDGAKMREAREAAGLGLREVAAAIGIAPMTLSRLERSNRTTEDQARQFLRAVNGG